MNISTNIEVLRTQNYLANTPGYDLPGDFNPAANSNVAGKIDFTWDFRAKSTDLVVLVAYCPTLGKASSVIGDPTRVTGSQTMTLPEIFSGQQVHTYIGFCNPPKTQFSNGEFLETVAVA